MHRVVFLSVQLCLSRPTIISPWIEGLDPNPGEKQLWIPQKPWSVHTPSVRARHRRANTAARSAKQWKRRRTLIARANTLDAKVKRTNHGAVTVW